MSRFPLLPRPFQTSAQAIVLMLWMIVCAETAMASCGDYVHRRNVNSEQPKKMQSSLPTDDGFRINVNSHQHQIPTLPCSGPGCHRLPDSHSMPLTTTSIVLPTIKLSAIVELDGLLPSNCERRLSGSSDGVADRGFPPLIDVPPECV